MKLREGEPSGLAVPPDCDVEWAVRTWTGDTLFVWERTAWRAVAKLGLGFLDAKWVRRIPDL